MRTHTNNFKSQIKEQGREIDARITYNSTSYDGEHLFSIKPILNTDLLKSVMKQLEITTDVNMNINGIVKFEFGLNINSSIEWLSFGNYVIYEKSYDEATLRYTYKCYDKMVYAMKDYESLGVTYPITVDNYINAIATKLGLTFSNHGETFVNSSMTISSELFLDSSGDSLSYTFRDVLDQLAQVTASNIIINDDDELELKYITNTSDTIDGEYIKNVNANFKETFGPVNVIVASRSADTDTIHYPTTLPASPIEIKISDNEFLNNDNRADWLPAIYNQLNGLTYSVVDYDSYGILYYEAMDKYTISLDNSTYTCLMTNDEIEITDGISETIYTDLPETTETDYETSSSDDRQKNRTSLIVDKQNNTITSITGNVEDLDNQINGDNGILVKQSSTELKINAIATTDSDGNVTGVKTSKGFTFDANGLNISSSENQLNTQITNTGTYYKDGEEVLGQTTKDGSNFKNMELFGEFRYGKDTLDDTALFVGMKYNDGTEDCFGHFYNGED